MVLDTLTFLEDATDREGFPDKELVSQNLSSWKKKPQNLKSYYFNWLGWNTGLVIFFFNIDLLLGMTKYFLFWTLY